MAETPSNFERTSEMARPRDPWNIRPAKKTASVAASIKAEVEAKARDLIENVLRPKHVVSEQWNYITDIGAKWFRNYFYFFSIYACPSPNALSPTFESKFARMEPLGGGKFALYFMRHTGEWVGIYDGLSADECMQAIRDDPWFVP
jgi:hypothetical protein